MAEPRELLIDVVLPLLTRGGQVIDEAKGTVSLPAPEGEQGESVDVAVTVRARGQTFTDTFPLPCGEDYGERLTVRLAGAVVEPRGHEEITVSRDADGNMTGALKELY